MFHPDAGYHENIISKYFVRMGHKVSIITSTLEAVPDNVISFFGRENIADRDREYSLSYGVDIYRLPLWKYVSGRAIYHTKQLQKTIKAIAPDIVYIHGNDTWVAMWYLRHLRDFPYALILDSHMLDMASRNPFRKFFYCYYRHFITPIIIRNNIPVIRIQNDDFVSKRLAIPLSQSPLISVGSDTTIFHPDIDVRKSFREKHAVPHDALVFLYAGKIDAAKGGKILATALKEKFITDRDVYFMIVGDLVGKYGDEVAEILADSKNKILRFPTQKYNALPAFYQAADVAMFPKQCSLSFYDVQACGLPVLFEDNVINCGRAGCKSAITFETDNVSDFRKKILFFINQKQSEYHSMSEAAMQLVADGYDYKDISQRYLEIIEECIKNG